MRQAFPMIAAIIRDVEVASRRAERQAITTNVQRVAVNQVKTILLRQSVTQGSPCFATVFGT